MGPAGQNVSVAVDPSSVVKVSLLLDKNSAERFFEMDDIPNCSAVPASVSLVSGRSYAVGDVVLSCEPWMWCFRWSAYQKVCAYCFKDRPGLQNCSKCRVHRYCDKKCQTADWKKEHKMECGIMQHIGLPHVDHSCSLRGCDRSADRTQIILMCKLAKRLELGVMHEFPGLGRKTVLQILSMFPSHPRPEEVDEYLPKAAPIVSAWTRIIVSNSSTPVPSYGDCMKIILHNQFPIRIPDSKIQTWGVALFPQALHWNMTPVCWDTNVTMDFPGRRLVIHAVQEIQNCTGLQELRFNELLLSPHYMTRLERREAFLRIHGHPCNCHKCSEDYDAEINPLKCVTVGCMERLPSDNRALEPCPQCGAINADRLEKFRGFMRQCTDISILRDRDPDLFAVKSSDLLNEIDTAGIVHEYAHIRFICGRKVSNSLMKEGEYEKAWKLHQQLMPCVREIIPKLHVVLGQRLMDGAFGPIAGVAKVSRTVYSRRLSVSESDLRRKLYALYPDVLDLLKEAQVIFAELCGEDFVRMKWISNAIEEVERHVQKGRNGS